MLAVPCNSRPGRDNGPDARPSVVARRNAAQPQRGDLVPIPGTERLGLFVGRRNGVAVIANRPGLEYARKCVEFDEWLDQQEAGLNRQQCRRRRRVDEERARAAKASARGSMESFA